MRRELSELDRLDMPDVRGRMNQRTRFSDVPDLGPELSRPVSAARRTLVIVAALAIFAVAIGFAWSAFRPGDSTATPGTVTPTPASTSPLMATLDAPADGSIPSLTLAYGNAQHDFFAQGGHWPGVDGFIQPLLAFRSPLPPGTHVQIASDASSVTGELAVLDQQHQDTGETLPLDLQSGSAILPTDPGSYRLHVTGTWPQGTAEYFVEIQVEQPTPAPGSSLKTFVNPRGIPITVAYPADWFAASSSGHSWLHGNGVVVVNDRREMWNDPRSPFGTHIRDFVGVTVFKALNHAPSPTDSSFPLDMANAKVDPGWGQESVRYLNAQVQGVPIRIMVLAAKGASPADVAAAEAIVASIRPLSGSEQTGTPSPSDASSNPLDRPKLTHVQIVPQRIVSSSPDRLIVEAPYGKVRWKLDKDCGVIGAPVGGANAGGFGGGGCDGGALSANLGGLRVGGIFYDVIRGHAYFGREVTVRATYVDGTTAEVVTHNGLWMLVDRPDPELYSPASRVATVEAISSTGQVLDRVRVP